MSKPKFFLASDECFLADDDSLVDILLDEVGSIELKIRADF